MSERRKVSFWLLWELGSLVAHQLGWLKLDEEAVLKNKNWFLFNLALPIWFNLKYVHINMYCTYGTIWCTGRHTAGLQTLAFASSCLVQDYQDWGFCCDAVQATHDMATHLQNPIPTSVSQKSRYSRSSMRATLPGQQRAALPTVPECEPGSGSKAVKGTALCRAALSAWLRSLFVSSMSTADACNTIHGKTKWNNMKQPMVGNLLPIITALLSSIWEQAFCQTCFCRLA